MVVNYPHPPIQSQLQKRSTAAEFPPRDMTSPASHTNPTQTLPSEEWAAASPSTSDHLSISTDGTHRARVTEMRSRAPIVSIAAQSPCDLVPITPGPTFTVNSNADLADKNPGDGNCDVDLSQPGNQCTLRAAIQEANSISDPLTRTTIEFQLGSAAPSISIGGSLLAIVRPVFIDGGTGKIELRGDKTGTGLAGLHILAGNSIIHGLVINNFSGDGILIEGSQCNVVTGSFIGTNATGDAVITNGFNGVEIFNSPNNTIGCAEEATPGTPRSGPCNVLSGNTFSGVRISGASSTGNKVLGNHIGTDVAGTSISIGNKFIGVLIESPGNLVGGTQLTNPDGPCSGACNVVSGNAQDGITVIGAKENNVIGNFIGSDVSGNLKVPNAGSGVQIFNAPSNHVGDGSSSGRNLISGNGSSGILIADTNATSNTVTGNFIGTKANGTEGLSNAASGVLITAFNGIVGREASGNFIGGTAPGEGNLISANNGDGIRILFGAFGNKVWGNSIGTDFTGMRMRDSQGRSLGNSINGVAVVDSPRPSGVGFKAANEIGGPGAGKRNVISGNGQGGVLLGKGTVQTGANTNIVQGNYIGTDKDGAVALGNGQVTKVGGLIIINSQMNQIGGPLPEQRNIISGNATNGVFIAGKDAKKNTLMGNYIGVKANGAEPLGNDQSGILVSSFPSAADSASENQIGGPGNTEGNVVSANGRDGIQIAGGASLNNIWGNLIGTDATGRTSTDNQGVALGNTRHGVSIFSSPENFIGGPRPGTACSGRCNVISGNGKNGVSVLISGGSLSANNQIIGNFIGTSRTGDKPLGNRENGVLIDTSTTVTPSPHINNTVGGSTRASAACEGPCNVISGNVLSGVQITGVGTTGNHVVGNYIGLSPKTAPQGPLDVIDMPNLGSGVVVKDGAAKNLIGDARSTSACDGPCNVISGNTENGVTIAGDGTNENEVKGNYIGITPDGNSTVANGRHGVYIADRVTGAPDVEAAFGYEMNQSGAGTGWPEKINGDATACKIKDHLASFSGNQDSIDGLRRSVKGFLFELLMDHEFARARPPEPKTEAWDAIDELGRLWQMKSRPPDSPDVACKEILKLLPGPFPTQPNFPATLNDVWGLILPKDTDNGKTCGDKVNDQPKLNLIIANKRIDNSSVVTDFDAVERIDRLFAYAATGKPAAECSGPPPPSASTLRNIIGGDHESGKVECEKSCNVISGNTEAGILIFGAGAKENKVKGNYIGLNPQGTQPLGNKLYGVGIQEAPLNTVGGATRSKVCDGPCNVISGNGLNGVWIWGTKSVNNGVQGNFIGVNPQGDGAIKNGMAGVALKDGPTNNIIGGARSSIDCEGPCNLIAGNGTDGVFLWGAGTNVPNGLGTSLNEVTSNYIGSSLDRTFSIPNKRNGVALVDGASQNAIGFGGTANLSPGECKGFCNLIRGNGASGVAVIGNQTTQVTIRGNSLVDNGGLPIDLIGNRATPGGPNDLVNAPTISTSFDGTNTSVTVTLDAPNPNQHQIDLYRSDQPEPANFEETITLPYTKSFTGRVTLSATATNPRGSTSEFSRGNEPLIFIPGVAGSKLVDLSSNTEYWPSSVASQFTDRHSKLSLFTPLPVPALSPTDVVRSGFDFLGVFTVFDVYGELLKRLTTREGYREHVAPEDLTSGCGLVSGPTQPNLFVFPYDWRKSIVANALRLSDYVNCIKQLYPGSKIDVLTHSAGGLLARRYIVNHPADHGIDRLITVNAPFLGAPKVLNILENGKFDVPIGDAATFKKIAGSFRGVHQLLPGPSYFTLGNPLSEDRAAIIEDGWDLNRNGNPLEFYSYDQTIDSLNARYGCPAPDLLDGCAPAQQEFRPGFEADFFHRFGSTAGVADQTQDDWSSTGFGAKYFHLFGVQRKADTVRALRATFEFPCPLHTAFPNLPVDLVCIRLFATLKPTREDLTSGDGTVPQLSAERCFRPSSNDSCLGTGLNAPDARLYGFFHPTDDDQVEHTKSLRNPEYLETIVAILAKNDVNHRTTHMFTPQEPVPFAALIRQSVRGSLAASLATEPFYFVQISVGTSLVVSDDLGNNTGPIVLDGAAIVNTEGEVPGVKIYHLANQVDVVTLPTTGNHVISFTATDRPLAIEVTAGTKLAVTQAVRYLGATVPNGTKAQIRLTGSVIEDLEVDSDGDGTFETKITPTVSLTGNAANDTTPPTLSVTTSIQSPNALAVTINASDSGSGLKGVYSSLDGTNFHLNVTSYVVDPQTTANIYAFALDNAGNRKGLVFPINGSPSLTNLSIAMTASPNPVLTSSNVSYTIKLTNGIAIAQSVNVDLTLPPETTFVSCSVPGVSCTAVGNRVSLAFASLQPGAIVDIAAQARVNCSTIDGAALTARAEVSAASGDLNPADNVVTTSITANKPPPTITCPPNVVKSNDRTQCAAVVNFTPAASDNCGIVIVVCNPPSGSTFPKGITPVTCTATDAAGSSSSCTFNVSVIDTAPPSCPADLVVTKSASPDPVVAGANLVYSIKFVNNGPGDASTVTVTDAIPAAATLVSATVTTGSGWGTAAPPVGGSGNVVFSKALVAAGETAVFTMVVNINASAANGSTITNSAVAVSNNDDSTPGNNASTVTTNVITNADLQVTKTNSPDPVIAGRNLTYTLNIKNAGPSNAQAFTLTDAVPANTTFVSAAATTGFGWNVSPPSVGSTGTNVVFSKSLIASGETAVFTVVVRVNPNTPHNTIITNSATGASITPDGMPGNNTGTATATVLTQADLGATITDSPDPVCVQGDITYTLNVTNFGPGPAINTRVTDAVPANATFVSASVTGSTGWSINAPPIGGTGNVVFSKSSTAAMESMTFRIVARVNAGTIHGTVITNTATVSSDLMDTIPSNNSTSATTTVDPTPPTLVCPSTVTGVTNQAACEQGGCSVVSFATPTAMDNCPSVQVVCVPPSGSCLPTGSTMVTCTGTDTAGNTASCSFTVTVFDVCLQDDGNPNTVLLLNSRTGAYKFCCLGTTYTGTGTVLVRGCTITFSHNAGDRRVNATIDKAVFRGTAAVQSPPGTVKCTITDRDIRNNTCNCP